MVNDQVKGRFHQHQLDKSKVKNATKHKNNKKILLYIYSTIKTKDTEASLGS